MAQINVVINGAAGRMGQRLVAVAAGERDLQIVAALERVEHPQLGLDAGYLAGIGELGIPLTDSLPEDGKIDAVVDFSLPAGAERMIGICQERQIPLVVATTGLSEEQIRKLRAASDVIPIVWAPSMSTAVNLAMNLARKAAGTLAQCDADVEILERHHRFKVDSPSGTALKFGEIIAQEMGITHFTHGREGMVGARPHNEIGYHAIRTGDNPGEHTIVFGMMGETLEITVRCSSRDCYAKGAFAAARFLQSKTTGLYDMFDVLGLK